MLTQILVLPRMRAIKNRQLFFLKKKLEIQNCCNSQQSGRASNPESQIQPYYLQTLNKFTRLKRPRLSVPQHFTQPLITFQKQTKSRLAEFEKKPSKQIKRGLCFNKGEDKIKRSEIKSQSLSRIDITIGNGDISQRIQDQQSIKQRRKSNLLKFKRFKERKTLTHRLIEAKTARQSSQKFMTFEDSRFEQMISKTKYLHPRPEKKYFMDDFENINFSNKLRQYTPRRKHSQNSNDEQSDVKSIKTQQELNIDSLQRKYKSLVQGFGSSKFNRQKKDIDKNKVKVKELQKEKGKQYIKKSKNINVFNTFNLTGW